MFLKLFFLFFVYFTYQCAAIDTTHCQEVNSTMASSNLSVSACANYNGKVYWVIETKLYFDEALKACQKYRNGSMTSIHSLEEYKFLYFLSGFYENGSLYDKCDNVWIGLVRQENDCSMPFHWLDGSPVDYEYWDNDEPNCEHGNEHCSELANWGDSVQEVKGTKVLRPDYGWNDLPCTGARPDRSLCSA